MIIKYMPKYLQNLEENQKFMKILVNKIKTIMKQCLKKLMIKTKKANQLHTNNFKRLLNLQNI